jgi:hypothetical protein
MSYDASKVAFVDIETTGLDPETDHIWEIAVIVDGEEHVWQQRIPGIGMTRVTRLDSDGSAIPGTTVTQHDWSTISPWVVENTGIRERYDHASADSTGDSIVRFCNLVDGRHLVGACPWFDSERLHRVLLRHYTVPDERLTPWHYHLIDVENLAVGFILGVRHAHRQSAEYGYPAELYDGVSSKPLLPWDSTRLSVALGVDPADFEPKHSALADARWAKALYEKIMGPPR